MKLILTSALICAICGANSANAQTKISLQNAIDTAIKNSIKLKTEKLNTEYLQRLTKTAYDIPNTDFVSELGQVNSNLFDAKIGASQTIKFPSVYKKQKQLLIEEAKTGEWNEANQKRFLTKQVTTVFYEMIYIKEKEKLLLKTDSIYAEFLRKAKLRLDKGESNVLEKLTAENQLGQIKVQLTELQADYTIAQSQFTYLLQTKTNFFPRVEKYKIDFAETIDDSFSTTLPSMQLLLQEQKINMAKEAVEKTKKLPNLIGGLNGQSFRDGSSFRANNLGAYAQIGLSFQLFNTAIKNKLKALEVTNKVTANLIAIEKQHQQQQYQQLLQQYYKHKKTVSFYETDALKNVSLVLSTANKKFINGDINYLEWVMLINQNVTIESNYVEAVKQLNMAVYELQLLVGK
jgi:heavy metal efflux system protein